MILILDVETMKGGEPILDATGKHVVFVGLLQDNNVFHKFYNKEEAWEKILYLKEKCKKRGKKLTIYGHNMKYDFFNTANLKDRKIKYFSENPFIAGYYEKEEVEMSDSELFKFKRYAKSNNIYCKVLSSTLGVNLVEKEREAIKFLDSMSLFRMSVKRLGDIIELPKLEMPESKQTTLDGKSKRLGAAKMRELEIYCKRDCEIVLKGIKMLKEKLKDDGVNIRNLCTVSQVAISYLLNELRGDENSENILYRNKEGKLTEWVHKTKYPEDVHNAYRGGYVRAWKTGVFKKCHAVDCNSLYPFSAMKMRFPDLRTERKIIDPLSTYDKEVLFNKIGVSKVIIKNESDKLGLLMIRTSTKGYVPLDGKYIIGTWTHRELKKALENGYKLKGVEWSIIYEDGRNILKEIYQKLYNRRIVEDNGFNKMFYKDIMNRSIGKFGQHKESYELFIDNVEEMWRYLDDKHELLRGISEDSYDIIIKKKINKTERKKYYNPIIPALITAEARCYMYDNYKKIPNENLLYSDTDSIIFTGNKEMLNVFKLGDKLGEFKIETDIITGDKIIDKECIIYGTKSKSIGNNLAVAGAFKSGITLESFKKGEVPIKRMIGLKQGDLNKVGSFNEEVKDLEKQKEHFIKEKNVMDNEMIYIDERVKDISYFKGVLQGVTQEIVLGKGL